MSKTRQRDSGFSLEVLSRIDSRDMLILQETTGRALADIARFYAVDHAVEGAALEATSREALESAYGYAPHDEDERKPFVYQDGVAVIPIHGTLLNRCNYSYGFVTGYQYIRRMLNLALDDDDVQLVVFDIDSPGGEAAGCFELAREIMASRRVKPSLAMVDSLAASGGIALAAPATSLYAIPSARIGSIGVYRMHMSFEDALKKEGIKVTFAAAGAHKVDGNPYQDLPDSVLNEWREAAGKTWDDFISLIAEARDLTDDEVRDTQARVYRADEALAKGLIDAVKTPTEAVAAFLAELADDPSFETDEEEIDMAVKPNGEKEVTSGLTAADKAEIKQLVIEATATAVGAAMSGIQRSQAIRDHAAAKGKHLTSLAATLIANENLSTDEAIAIIDAAAGTVPAATKVKQPSGKQKAQAADPEDDDDDDSDDDDDDSDDDDSDEAESARRSRRQGRDEVNHFENAMSKSKHPNAGGGKAKGGNEGGNDDDKPKGNRLLLAHAQVTGADWSSKAAKNKH